MPLRELRLLLREPKLAKVEYFRAAFPEHYFYHDINEWEFLVLLMVPPDQVSETETFVAERMDRVRLYGFNCEPIHSSLLNFADLEAEYDYEAKEWKDIFRTPEQ